MACKQHVITLQSIQVGGSQLSVRYSYDDYHFSQSFWYDFNLQSLDTIYGSQFMEKVYFHCAAFSVFQLCSLKPDVLDWGPYAHLHTAEFERVWKTAWNKLSGQWRYENNLPHVKEARFASKPTSATNPVEIQHSGKIPTTLVFFGGGKDSLTMMELLSRADIPFYSLSYSHTMYGCSTVQHQLNDVVLDSISPTRKARHHKLNVLDDLLDSPVLDSLGKSLGIKTFAEAETTASLFFALPILLYYRYTAIAIANERSANTGNLVWECTGEEINHQWVKSKEAELLLGSYVREALIRNAHYFSVLQPIHDVVIFNTAATRPDAIVHTHSCNIVLPWCKRCSKCCYVWLNFMAYLPCDLVNGMFQNENLLDARENETHFTQMIGLGAQRPFECIGDFDEAKLAFELCRRKGIRGCAMAIYEEKVLPTLNQAVLTRMVDKYTAVYPMESTNVPPEIWDRLLPVLKQAGEDARKKLETALLQ